MKKDFLLWVSAVYGSKLSNECSKLIGDSVQFSELAILGQAMSNLRSKLID